MSQLILVWHEGHLAHDRFPAVETTTLLIQILHVPPYMFIDNHQIRLTTLSSTELGVAVLKPLTPQMSLKQIMRLEENVLAT